MNRLLFDLEADGLLDTISKVHCLAATDLDTNQSFEWGPNEIPQALETLSKADVVSGHYIKFYDLPALTKVCGFKLRPEVKLRDTFICARVIHPDIARSDEDLIRQGKMPRVGPISGKQLAGRHSIEAWGYRLGEQKVGTDITVWAEWTQAIQDRCVGDVSTNKRLYRHLKIDDYSQAALDLEHRIADVCEAMTKEGWPLDVEAAGELYSKLAGEKEAVEKALTEQFGFWYAPISPNPAKYTFVPKKDNAKLGYVKGQACSKIEQITFNPGSDAHVARVLMKQGWKPVEYTPGGRPTVDETVLQGLVGRFPEAEGLARHRLLRKRVQQIADGDKGWLKSVREHSEYPQGNKLRHRVHGSYNPMGTVTSRAAHYDPNIGQVPSAKKPYGKECRSLFTVPKGWRMVGADQKSLELLCLGHYLAKHDGGAYGETVMSGDPHWMTVKGLGFTKDDRIKGDPLHEIMRESGAKRWLYATIYGGGSLQSGLIILEACHDAFKAGFDIYHLFFKSSNPSEEELRRVGAKVIRSFKASIDGLKKLDEVAKGLSNANGWLPGLDGRIIPSRSEHSALNALLQSAGAIVCKQWGCDAFEELSARYQHGWEGEFVFLGWIHDEYQVAAREGLEDEVGETLVRCARKAGEPFNFRVPLDSSYSVGASWADTH